MRAHRLAALALALALAACNRAPSEPPSATPTSPLPAPPPPPGAVSERPARVAARHVLVMHRGSERVPAGITRTRDEARARAEEVLRKARAGEDFAQLARTYSDEPGAASSGGDLGDFGPGQMVPPFERAAFALAVNAISDVVETDFGFHVIRRTR
jgi:NIMA-interacting peptidyl-prolyl cis-trans isomerase 1